MRSFNTCNEIGFLLAKIWLTGYLSKGKANIFVFHQDLPLFPLAFAQTAIQKL
jgi:hypothetical protein